jgi:hypothetical protein
MGLTCQRIRYCWCYRQKNLQYCRNPLGHLLQITTVITPRTTTAIPTFTAIATTANNMLQLEFFGVDR